MMEKPKIVYDHNGNPHEPGCPAVADDESDYECLSDAGECVCKFKDVESFLCGFVKRRKAFKAKTGVDWRYMPTAVIIDTKTGKIEKVKSKDVEEMLKGG